MYNTKLGRFCAAHSNWEELLTAEPYCLKISRDGAYIMFKYDQIKSDFNNPMAREARGIIFKEGEWENPVCWAFNKFGNYGENYVPEIDWLSAFVSEKIDGSLIKLWYDNGRWHVSTNGTIDAFKATLNDLKMPNFGVYFSDTVDTYYGNYDGCSNDGLNYLVEMLDPDLTYMFELVGPYNRVVIPYERPEIYFLGARNKYTGKEYTCDALTMELLCVDKFRRPKIYHLTTLEECIKATAEFDWNQEGFVVADSQFNRVKIKSPAYVLAHYARNNNVITNKHLIRVILANELEEFLCYAADYKAEILACKALMDTYYKLCRQLINVCHKARLLPRKAYAEVVKCFPKFLWDLLFRNYEQNISPEDYTLNWSEEKWEVCLEEVKKLKQEYFN